MAPPDYETATKSQPAPPDYNEAVRNNSDDAKAVSDQAVANEAMGASRTNVPLRKESGDPGHGSNSQGADGNWLQLRIEKVEIVAEISSIIFK